MCVKFPLGNLNLNRYFLYRTITYICRPDPTHAHPFFHEKKKEKEKEKLNNLLYLFITKGENAHII